MRPIDSNSLDCEQMEVPGSPQRRIVALVMAMLVATQWQSVGQCEPPRDDQLDFFESRIRPVLVQQCYECHNSSDAAEGDLVLDFRDGVRKGGAGGRILVAGQPDSSRLMAILRHEVDGLEMPEGGPKLDDSVIADFETWILNGAVDPRDAPPTEAELAAATSWATQFEQRLKWWSFQPIRDYQPPDVTDSNWSTNPVDQFISAGLKSNDLQPSRPADNGVLIRRLYFVLIGLPPTPDELDRWSTRLAVNGPAHSQAVEALIDELLGSPHFGERWARHWMDWIRYAESHGSEGDPAIDNAWYYRDYLIRALNADVPYDQLVREHIAGDLLESPRINLDLSINESAIGPAHWRMVFHGFAPTDALDERVRFTDDQINTFSKAFLGLTVSCARCHDHKFDAISQADYYALFGILNSCRPARTVIDVSKTQDAKRQKLKQLKSQIRTALGEAWTQQLHGIKGDKSDHDGASGPLPERVVANDSQDQIPLREWYMSGVGLADRTSASGDFVVALSGDSVVDRILPEGVFSNLLSSKDPARMATVSMQLEDNHDVWLRVIGDGGSTSRYVVQNYPRNGTVYPVKKLKPEWHWVKYDLTYWNGDSVHIELTTGKDAPLLVDNQDRSWFGIRAAWLLPAGSAPPESEEPSPVVSFRSGEPAGQLASLDNSSADRISAAVQAWQEDALTDPQAMLLQHCIETQLLSNRVADLPQVDELLQDYRRVEDSLDVPRRVPGLEETVGSDQPLYVRGDHRQPGPSIPRRFLEAVDATPYDTKLSGRRELAEDLLRDDNPFARRVIVNRIWHHLFGRGIVATPDNFGRMGQQPTHPELLDWLSMRFVDDRWSIKRMIRRIVTSRTWQQSSVPSETAATADPENHWLSHANVRRLEAEAIRDQLLAVSGELNRDLFGPPTGGESNRRSVYVRVIRNNLDPFLRTFDFPEPFSAVGRRNVTNVPAQSLTMLNDSRIGSLAEQWARRVLSLDHQVTDGVRIQLMYRTALSREPTSSEMANAKRYLADARTARRSIHDRHMQLTQTLAELKTERSKIIDVATSRLARNTDRPRSVVQPTSLVSRWSFDDTSDSVGQSSVTLQGGARLESGALVLESPQSWAESSPISQTLTEKTLEAWVRLTNLDQRGGGLISLQTRNGVTFDAIVFAEKDPRQWLAGSNGFARTQSFQAPVEAEADDRPVHLAITYDSGGIIRGYRDGKPYGKSYQSSGPQTFAAGDSVVTLGLRHLPASGNRFLSCQILEARLHNKCLTPEQVKNSSDAMDTFISEAALLATLSESERDRLNDLTVQIASVEKKLADLPQRTTGDPEHFAWADLARAMFCFKEFIFLR
jgi:Protein of unknown function (DUF1553)/Protein of unknown function (DUF1549)/Concanavalin A-like lectin/glucanases superfamily/Planctomycete cytochrome C